VYSYGPDGFVHKHQVGDGAEILTGGWPQIATLKGFDEKGSAAIAFATSQGVTYLYVVHGGYPGDNGDYQGHVTAINLATGGQKVFNTMCSNQVVHLGAGSCGSTRSAIWARPSVIYDAAIDRIFMGTGNGSYNGNIGGNNWSESVIALNPDATGAGGKPIDAYTATNFQSLDNADADLGSTAPAILPTAAASVVQHLAVQAGKDGLLRLINLANLSGQGGPGHTGGEIGSIISVPQGTGAVLTQPAVGQRATAPRGPVTNGNGIWVEVAVRRERQPVLVSPWHNAQGGASHRRQQYPLLRSGARALELTSGVLLWAATDRGHPWESPIVQRLAVCDG
jgi:hypothetical protein